MHILIKNKTRVKRKNKRNENTRQFPSYERVSIPKSVLNRICNQVETVEYGLYLMSVTQYIVYTVPFCGWKSLKKWRNGCKCAMLWCEPQSNARLLLLIFVLTPIFSRTGFMEVARNYVLIGRSYLGDWQ